MQYFTRQPAVANMTFKTTQGHPIPRDSIDNIWVYIKVQQ